MHDESLATLAVGNVSAPKLNSSQMAGSRLQPRTAVR
jgi:hypothetical protein